MYGGGSGQASGGALKGDGSSCPRRSGQGPAGGALVVLGTAGWCSCGPSSTSGGSIGSPSRHPRGGGGTGAAFKGTSVGGHEDAIAGRGRASGGSGGGGAFVGWPGLHPGHGMTMEGVGDGGSDQNECFGSTPGDGGRRVGMGTGGAAALTFGGHGVGLDGATVRTLVPDEDFGDTGMLRRSPFPFPGVFTLALYSSRGGGLDRYSAQGSSSPELAQGSHQEIYL